MKKDQIKRSRERMVSLQVEMDKIDLGALRDQAELVSGDLGKALDEIDSLTEKNNELKKTEGFLMEKIDSQIKELEKVDRKLLEALGEKETVDSPSV